MWIWHNKATDAHRWCQEFCRSHVRWGRCGRTMQLVRYPQTEHRQASNGWAPSVHWAGHRYRVSRHRRGLMTQTRLWEMHWAPYQSRSPQCAPPAVAVVSSDFVLADISVKSPRKLYTLISQNDSSRIKVSKTCIIYFWKQNHWRTIPDRFPLPDMLDVLVSGISRMKIERPAESGASTSGSHRHELPSCLATDLSSHGC